MQVRKVIRVLKTPVTLLLLLGILGYGAYWGYHEVTKDTSRPETPCVTQDVGTTLTSYKISVRVLNGGEQALAANHTRFTLVAWHYHIVSWNNSKRQVDKVTVIGNSADDPEVQLVAQAFKPPVVTEGDGRADHVVDVILPTRFEMLKTLPTSIPVNGPVCLPAINNSASENPSGSASDNPGTSPSASKK